MHTACWRRRRPPPSGLPGPSMWTCSAWSWSPMHPDGFLALSGTWHGSSPVGSPAWNLPWIEAWRLGEPPSLEFIPKAVRAMVTDLNTGMGEQWFKKFLGWLIAFISLIAMPALMKFVAPMASLGGAMAGSAGLVGGKLASGAMKLGQDQADNGAHRPAWHRRDGHRGAKEVKPAMAVCTVAHAEHHAGQTGRVSSGTVATA